ncbi:hypothetical protein [Streptomyces sp. NPDC092307]|uniref:hypothetical protein n=1 Tax=Streptomyces sp. NPDC092307 TaxID=3366013 RepID=UPI00381578BB
MGSTAGPPVMGGAGGAAVMGGAGGAAVMGGAGGAAVMGGAGGAAGSAVRAGTPRPASGVGSTGTGTGTRTGRRFDASRRSQMPVPRAVSGFPLVQRQLASPTRQAMGGTNAPLPVQRSFSGAPGSPGAPGVSGAPGPSASSGLSASPGRSGSPMPVQRRVSMPPAASGPAPAAAASAAAGINVAALAEEIAAKHADRLARALFTPLLRMLRAHRGAASDRAGFAPAPRR